MTKEQMNKELLYHASLSPFKKLLDNKAICEAEYQKIESILKAKYSPIFVENRCQILLDNKSE